MARRSGQSRFVFVVLILLSVTIVTVYYRGHARTLVSDVKGMAHDVVDPIGHGVAAVVHPVEHFFQGAAEYGSVMQANARLRAENEKLQGELGAASRSLNEADQLKQQLGLPYLQGMTTVAANVVDTTPSDFEASVEIDKGSTSGVATGMPVVSGDGLVGTVVQVSASSSIVQLITDASSRVAVRFDGGPGHLDDVAVVDGEGAGAPLKVEYVNPADHLKKGQLMFTSGLTGGTFPPDIPVGKVRSVAAGEGSLQLAVTLAPVSAIGNLQFVSVVEWEPSA